MDQFKEVFKQEATEIISNLEENLLDLEVNPSDSDNIQKIYRGLHTLKGSGAMFGFNNIAEFVHEFENLFDLVRQEKIAPDKKIIDITLSSCDYIKLLLENTDGETWLDTERRDHLLEEIGSYTEDFNISEQQQNSKKIDNKTTEKTFRIRFKPKKEIFKNGCNPLLLLRELIAMGKGNVFAYLEEIPTLEKIDPESCYTYWDIILTTNADENAILDVFIFVMDESEITVTEIETDSDQPAKKLGEILVERGDILQEELQSVIDKKELLGEMLVNEGLTNKEKINSAIIEQKKQKEVQEKKLQKIQQTSVRIASDKLDALVNLVGELVTSQARLSQFANKATDPELLSIAEETERMIWELRDNTMNMRMLPVGTAFSRLKRLVRDLSADMGKDIMLTTDGEETELDKTIIEKLNDPLVHLIRNSIDHGIEEPELRKKNGKQEKGHIHLSAFHSGASVIIRIKDDGKGLDKDKIRNKAIEKELISADVSLSDKEIYKLIFEPGFSTAEQVTNVSGRGVGMDVVKKNISSLRGSIDIESELSQGTTITLKLPLTLAIIEGMLVEIGKDNFVLPLHTIEGAVEFTDENISHAKERDMIKIRGEIVPYINLRNMLEINSENGHEGQIILVNTEEKKVGFLVDNIIGKHQTVIKSLGKVYQEIEGISGATILGNGDIALILDLDQLIKIAHNSEEELLHKQKRGSNELISNN